MGIKLVLFYLVLVKTNLVEAKTDLLVYEN